MQKCQSIIIALDLEGTLISNAVSQIPRPGLFSFLEYCQQNFTRIVVFTTVKESLFRQIASTLVSSGKAPAWLCTLEYINWQGEYKDLSFVPNLRKSDSIFLIDDMAAYIKPEQKPNWISIPSYNYPYSNDEDELNKIRDKLSKILTNHEYR